MGTSLKDRLGQALSRAFDHYKREAYIESIVIDVFLLIYFFLRIFLGLVGAGGYIYYGRPFYIFIGVLALLLGLVFFIIKSLSDESSRKVLGLNLLMEVKREGVYLVFFIINLILFALAFSFRIPDFSLVLLILLRIILVWEDMVIQNKTLRGAIRETQSYEDISVYSPMMNSASREALMDLTRINDQMYRAAQESFQSQKMKSELITNISHDLKTPLTSIINYTDILSKKEVMDEEARNYLKVLGRNSERLRSMIVDLIEASKTGSGNVEVEPALLNFSELVSQIYGDFDSSYQDRGLDLTYEANQEDILVYSDPNILSRIIQNLLSNACKYAREGTRVQARTHLVKDRVFFNIRNLTQERLEEGAVDLKGQFTRSDRSRTTEGSGLGLYIASNLAEILGGQLRIVIDGDYFQAFLELPLEVDLNIE